MSNIFVSPYLKLKSCPSCNSNHIVPIIYGRLTLDDLERAERGQLKFGGSTFNENSPRYYCGVCKLKFLTNRELCNI